MMGFLWTGIEVVQRASVCGMEQSPTTTAFQQSRGHKPQIARHGSEDALALALAHRPHQALVLSTQFCCQLDYTCLLPSVN
jgi:hypothetical protein